MPGGQPPAVNRDYNRKLDRLSGKRVLGAASGTGPDQLSVGHHLGECVDDIDGFRAEGAIELLSGHRYP